MASISILGNPLVANYRTLYNLKTEKTQYQIIELDISKNGKKQSQNECLYIIMKLGQSLEYSWLQATNSSARLLVLDIDCVHSSHEHRRYPELLGHVGYETLFHVYLHGV